MAKVTEEKAAATAELARGYRKSRRGYVTSDKMDKTIVVEVEDRDLGSIPMHNVVPRLSASPGGFRRPAPELGEHTDEILGELAGDPLRPRPSPN